MEQEKTQTQIPKVIREFIYKEKKFNVVAPTARVAKEAKFAYSRKFTECIREGIFTRKVLEAKLKEQEADFFQEYQNTRAQVLQNMIETETTLEALDKTEENLEQIELLSQMLTLYRAQLLQEDQLMNEVFSNTADQLAEDERILMTVVGTILDEKLNVIWDSYEAVLNETDEELLEMAKYQVLCREYGLDPEWQEKLPEVESMQVVEQLKEEKKKAEEVEKPKKATRKRKTTTTKAKTTASKAATKKKTSTRKVKTPAE